MSMPVRCQVSLQALIPLSVTLITLLHPDKFSLSTIPAFLPFGCDSASPVSRLFVTVPTSQTGVGTGILI